MKLNESPGGPRKYYKSLGSFMKSVGLFMNVYNDVESYRRMYEAIGL
jgi:hypothetical protein